MPGKKFFYWAQILGWAIPAAIFTATIAATGVSFRLGQMCHVNHHDSMADFWGWLLGISAAATILQIGTFGYCAKVYLSNLWSNEDDGESTQASGGGDLPTYVGSTRSKTVRLITLQLVTSTGRKQDTDCSQARAIYRRLKRVIWLQWRGLFVVTITLADVIFFAVVFIDLDKAEQDAKTNPALTAPLLECLLATQGQDKSKCYGYGQAWLKNEATVSAVLFLLAFVGFQSAMVMSRMSILTGWKDLFMQKFMRKQEFVSLDAMNNGQGQWSSREDSHQRSTKGTMFEMQRPKEYGEGMSPTISTMNSPALSHQQSPYQQQSQHQPMSHFAQQQQPTYQQQPAYPQSAWQRNAQAYNPREYFNRGGDRERQQHLESMRRTPSNGGTIQSMGWDPTAYYQNGTPQLQTPREASQDRGGQQHTIYR